MTKGMSHDLTHYLAQANVFRVLETKPNASPLQHCSHIVRGTLRQKGENIRTAVSLTDFNSGELVWTKQWDFPVSGFFETQEKIVQEITNHLANTWSGQIAKLSFPAGGARETEDLDAYACFQRGVAAIDAHSVEGMLVAFDSLKTATQLDPDYGQAWACLSIVYGVLTTNATGSQLTELTRLRIDAAKRAFLCHPRSAPAYLVGAKLAAFDGDITEAKARLWQAIELAPWNSDVLAMATGIAALNTDLYDEAVMWGERALELSVTEPSWYYFPIGYSYFFREEFDQALAALAKGPQTFPELLAYKVACEVAIGSKADARITLRSLQELSPTFSVSEYLKSEPWGDAKKAASIEKRFLAAGIRW
jgi:adenylate cyclase